MSHEGKMRRGEFSTNPEDPDRIYFLEQSKEVTMEEETQPEAPTEEVKEEEVEEVKEEAEEAKADE